MTRGTTGTATSGRFTRRTRIAIFVCLLPSFLASWGMIGLPSVLVRVNAATTVPLLVMTDSANTADPYGAYLSEILRAEGMPTFATADLSTLSPAALSGVGVLLLGPTAALTPTQISTLTTYVQGGGQLIAMRPPTSVASLFGVTPAGSATNNGYLRISSAGLGAGFTTSSLQLHSPADNYTLNGATSIATLYSSATAATPYPAVTTFMNGQGRAMLWAYDLARSVVYTRQGDPARVSTSAGNSFDGAAGFQTTDLSAGYVDLNNLPIPQADEQQRLLAKAIGALSPIPLPHLWYFPQNAGSVLVLTGDAHGNPTSDFTKELTSIQKFSGHITFFLSNASQPAASDVTAWKQAGHGVGIHPYLTTFPQSSPCVDAGLQSGIASAQAWFQQQFGLAPSAAVRIHEFPWQCWSDAAAIESAAGIQMDTSFYAWGPWLKKPDNSWAHGYMNGSGLPMQMVDATGHLIPLYQQVTSVIDEQLVTGIASNQENLTGAQAAAVGQQLIDASLTGGNYAAITTQFHVDYYAYPDSTAFAEGMMAYAQSKGVPIWSADDWLRFTKARAGATFGTPSWDGTNLTFTMTVPSGPDTMPLMVPLTTTGGRLTSLTVDGAGVAFKTRQVKGTFSGVTSVAAGSHAVVATYASVMPSVSTIAPARGPVTGGTTVTLSGANFDPLATVTFGGVSATGVTVSPDGRTLTAVNPSHAAGAVDVAVTNPGNRTFTLQSAFLYVPPPSLTSISPSSGSTTGGTPATIVGTGFQQGAAVTIGGVAATGIIVSPDGTTISLTVPQHAAAGAVDVVVMNADGQSGTLVAAYTYGQVKVLPTPAPAAPMPSPPIVLPPPRTPGTPAVGAPPNPLPAQR